VNARALEEAESIKASLDKVLTPEIRAQMERAGLVLTVNAAGTASLHHAGASPDGKSELVFIDADDLAEAELLEEMSSYERKTTGIDNVVFLSPKGHTRHAARIKVAIDPWDSFDPRSGKTASIAIHDGSVTGDPVPRRLYDQLLAFIDLNRQTLLDYWDYKISTTTMEERLKPLPKDWDKAR
jgi:hypothetical protein